MPERLSLLAGSPDAQDAVAADGSRTMRKVGAAETDYAYDRTDQLAEQVDGSVHTSLAYDRIGELTTKAEAARAGADLVVTATDGEKGLAAALSA